MSLGNSQACGALARKAFDMEANMVNHAFNSRTQLVIGKLNFWVYLLRTIKIMCVLITDGEDVCKIIVNVFLRASNYKKSIFLVNDALASLELSNGIYPRDSR